MKDPRDMKQAIYRTDTREYVKDVYFGVWPDERVVYTKNESEAGRWDLQEARENLYYLDMHNRLMGGHASFILIAEEE